MHVLPATRCCCWEHCSNKTYHFVSQDMHLLHQDNYYKEEDSSTTMLPSAHVLNMGISRSHWVHQGMLIYTINTIRKIFRLSTHLCHFNCQDFQAPYQDTFDRDGAASTMQLHLYIFCVYIHVSFFAKTYLLFTKRNFYSEKADTASYLP